MSGARRRVVVVGGSLAGLNTCEGLRREGYDGAIVLVGDEPGLPYDRPPLSKEILQGTKAPAEIGLVSAARLAELGVEHRAGVRATGLDVVDKRVTVDGQIEPFDDLVIATGASARPLPGPAGPAGVHLLRTLSDAVALRDALERTAHLAVVGGGYIGAEVAAAARARGVEVTILDPMPMLLSRGIGSHLGHELAQLHTANGVTVRCGVGVEGFAGADSVEAVLTTAGPVPADTVVVGIGASPNTGWLESSGLPIADGVVCDAFCRVQASGGAVWAAGDVARFEHPQLGPIRLEHWTNAVEQAAAVARGICGRAERFAPVPYVWSDQYGKRLQCFGSVRPDDHMVVVDGEAGPDRFVAVFGRHDRLVGVVALDGGQAINPYRRLLTAGASWDEALAA